ncbi:MAG: DUF5677 domain-containing protein [Bacteroidota bacterium]|nr:DUF5677 domain-containing protein [Bacteroidota bacterium]
MTKPYIDTLEGAPEHLLINKESAFSVFGIIYRQLELWVKIVDNYGAVKCIDKTKEPTTVEYMDLFHDLVLFGYTKSCKSLLASRILIENIYQEDAQIILRSVYETYLSLNYVYRNPNTIEHFTKKSIGVSAGLLQHPTNKHGKKIKNQIINPDTNEVEAFGISIATLVSALPKNSEIKAHDIIYPYLCEHTHFNMISSGNYREPDHKKYTYINYHSYDQPIIIQEYIMLIFLDLIVNDIKLDSTELTDEIRLLNQIGKTELINHMNLMNLEDADKIFRQALIDRLKE